MDIGDKSWGVLACQNYLGGIPASTTLHVGDQFLSAGANDFKVKVFEDLSIIPYLSKQARLVCTTAWIANPTETVQLLDELEYHTNAMRHS